MKNYEIKYATKELAGSNTKIVNKRLAYLVSNMFTKMKNGNLKKINPIVANYQEEQNNKVITNTESSIVSDAKPITPAKEDVTPKINNDNKNYVIKADSNSITDLKQNKIFIKEAPRKLLISKLFVKKLSGNLDKKIKEFEASITIEDKELSVLDKQQQAVNEYISLNDEMKQTIKHIEEIKAKMIQLAKENGLTRSMVENAMQK